MMAAIYHYQTGDVITEGLPGSEICDEAWRCALEMARERNEPVVLDDDDGCWVIHPDGAREDT